MAGWLVFRERSGVEREAAILADSLLWIPVCFSLKPNTESSLDLFDEEEAEDTDELDDP